MSFFRLIIDIFLGMSYYSLHDIFVYEDLLVFKLFRPDWSFFVARVL